ncbi:cytochrome aa3-600 menaquinol oxidase subunit 1 [Pullulanibacillus pueri]|uniref:Cytochrome c oxidase subunit 1 n=1 Tax=Pullulanibacillus pueri TaxID=1437324 RepID=A0A8J2ZSP8_9BACL|nr:cbb3-type cytochrome c oxidase subunit I [Pullulanibacillus pueri]MBM7680314.1 cytochrome aa3-600 menaquinol oxidase subunit 1 [Pullulanibacillus pueri]GGH75701.1 quinol oxidase subunit 1 [Pullulanibacillus pueri]
MFDRIKSFASDFFVTGEPMIYASDVAIVLVLAAIIFTLTFLKKWKWLWREWITTVDHKKIGIMYLVSALLMMFRGGVDALLMRTQLALPDQNLLDPEHYNQIFTTHGTIMILFMAMPFLFAMFNIAVPLQLGARDVAFPFLNAVSFWLFFFGALLFNLSFVIGGSPDAGWTSYAPLTELGFDKGPGENFYLLGVQISGIGSMATGINFLVTILKMRAPGMKMMRLPLFCWSVVASCVVIIFAFPALTVALALLMIDRIAGAHFFTMLHGGNPMMFLNLFWVWGHPEVYIVVLPAYGIYSEIVSTFSKKKIFGYKTMVISLMIISVVSYFVWAHHYFTMGASAGVNSFFAVASMLIGIPTGVKIFNWLFTMFRGRISMKLPMLWTLAFIPCFAMGGATGIMLAMAPADYQYHNSYFLIAHFHQVLIGGVAFGLLAGMYYWWPKMFGFRLNEALGKWGFWFFNIGFYVCFMPQYLLGFMGMTRRVSTYSADTGWTDFNFISSIGAYLMGIGFLFIVVQVLYSIKYGERDLTGDPWNGRTLEWAIPSPAPHYNFAHIPEVKEVDAWWGMKERGESLVQLNRKKKFTPIHMPKNSGIPFIMAVFFFISGFGFVFGWYWIAALGLLGVAICMIARSNNRNTDYHIPAEEVEETEAAYGRV